MTNEFKLTIYRLIEEAEKMDMGLFTLLECPKEGDYVFDVKNRKMFVISDFVDMVMHERLRLHTMLERWRGNPKW